MTEILPQIQAQVENALTCTSGWRGGKATCKNMFLALESSRNRQCRCGGLWGKTGTKRGRERLPFPRSPFKINFLGPNYLLSSFKSHFFWVPCISEERKDSGTAPRLVG